MSSREAAKAMYFHLQSLAGRDRTLLRAIRASGHFPVLNLHDVSPVANPFWEPLHPRLFEALIERLVRHFRVTTFSELTSEPEDPRPPLILSFDDGYFSFLEYVMPTLERFGIRANLNVVPGCIESGEAPWTVRLADFLNTAPESLIRDLRLPGLRVKLESGQQGKVRFGLAISRHLKQRPKAERVELWDPIARMMEQAESAPGRRMLTAAEVRECGVVHEIGAHSFHHESMGHESDDYFLSDLSECRSYFDEILQIPLRIYAFPNGSHRPNQITALRDDGIIPLLVEEKLATIGQEAYPRLTIHGSSVGELWFRSLGWKASGAS